MLKATDKNSKGERDFIIYLTILKKKTFVGMIMRLITRLKPTPKFNASTIRFITSYFSCLLIGNQDRFMNQ